MRAFPPLVVRLVKGSLLFFPILTLLFWVSTPFGLPGALYLAALLELLPALAVAQLPLAADDEPLPRAPVYISSALLILVLGFLGLLIGTRELGREAMGIRSAPWGAVLTWTGVLFVVATFILLTFLLLRRASGLRETPLLVRLLPRTGGEKCLFVCLSLAAGVGEEIAFRGFLVPALAILLGWSWGAALLSSAVFGLLHVYQGWLGTVRTAVLGMALATSFILSGVLWPAMLAHAIVDVVAGVLLGDVLVRG